YYPIQPDHFLQLQQHKKIDQMEKSADYMDSRVLEGGLKLRSLLAEERDVMLKAAAANTVAISSPERVLRGSSLFQLLSTKHMRILQLVNFFWNNQTCVHQREEISSLQPCWPVQYQSDQQISLDDVLQLQATAEGTLMKGVGVHFVDYRVLQGWACIKYGDASSERTSPQFDIKCLYRKRWCLKQNPCASSFGRIYLS
ncbi:hypothetical protein C5167_029659, partial [Papaver somniferum]